LELKWLCLQYKNILKLNGFKLVIESDDEKRIYWRETLLKGDYAVSKSKTIIRPKYDLLEH
jgi:hypothetical protein